MVGLIEYLTWKEREYEEAGQSGQLGFRFCAAFDVEDEQIAQLENDLMADSLIRSTYCYDDFVAEQ